jgi:CRISPR-associated exonuclease Cas4
MHNEDDLLPISALQHLTFCRRQCALIHIEQLWADNLFTAQGSLLHERVHEEKGESRRDVRVEHGMPLRSLRLGLIGKGDVIEFRKNVSGKGWKNLATRFDSKSPAPGFGRSYRFGPNHQWSLF